LIVEWVRRAWDALAGGGHPPSPTSTTQPPEQIGNYQEIQRFRPIDAPAKGDVFKFEIKMTIIWHGEGITRAQLKELVATQKSQIFWKLHRRVTETARGFPPHEALELEQELRDQFAQPQTLDESVLLRWEAKFRVLPEERVREKLRPYWESRIELDSQHALDLRQVELVDKLTRRWSEVLEHLHGKRFTVEAARLAEGEFAKIMKELKDQEKDLFKDLQELLKDAARGHRTLGLYEYAQTYEKLIEEFGRRYEMFTAPPDSGSGS
jgi:hypothetical protein